VYDNKGLVTYSNGTPMQRGEHQPVDCRYCKKYDEKTGEVWKKFTKHNEYVFKSFLIAKAFGALPRPGAIDQQDPHLMDTFIMLDQIYTQYAESSMAEREVGLISAMLGAKL